MVTTRSSSSQSTGKFLVFCTAEIDGEILKTLISNERLVLVAQSDLSSLLHTLDDDSLASFTPPLEGHWSDYRQVMNGLIPTIKDRDDIIHDAFVILDETTAKDGKTCQIAGDIRLDQEYEGDESDPNDVWWDWTNLRCELSSVVACLETIEADSATPKSTLRRRNEAASCAGGMWRAETVSEMNARAARINVADYPQHEEWDFYSGTDGVESSIPYYPVFRTADVSAEMLNNFAVATYDQDWGDETNAPLLIAFVTSLTEKPYHAGPTMRPVTPIVEKPALPEEILGARPAELDAVVRSLFPAEGSELNYNRFIIMDEHTVADGETVVLASNCEFDGHLQLMRCNFKGALMTLMCPESTVLTMDTLASELAADGNGVSRM